jgi:ketosteroid isomerase-like protein
MVMLTPFVTVDCNGMPGGTMPPLVMVERLAAATNAHDVERIVDCFTEDYVNETPAHPARGFVGRDQVRRNWTAILAGVPDHRAELLHAIADGDTVWSEWRMSGTRRDGAAHEMTGVIVFGVRDNCAAWARFYLEPVDHTGDDADAAVATTLQGRR